MPWVVWIARVSGEVTTRSKGVSRGAARGDRAWVASGQAMGGVEGRFAVADADDAGGCHVDPGIQGEVPRRRERQPGRAGIVARSASPVSKEKGPVARASNVTSGAV